jgi:hypothetical protein
VATRVQDCLPRVGRPSVTVSPLGQLRCPWGATPTVEQLLSDGNKDMRAMRCRFGRTMRVKSTALTRRRATVRRQSYPLGVFLEVDPAATGRLRAWSGHQVGLATGASRRGSGPPQPGGRAAP